MLTVALTAAVYDRLAGMGIDLARRIGPATVHPDTEFEAPCTCQATIHAGVPFRLGAFSGVIGGVVHASIGRYCSIAGGVMIGPGDHPLDRLTTSWVGYVPEFRGWRARVHGDSVPPVPPAPHVGQRPVQIGHDVWIGANAFVRGGITIGHGAVVAAGSVVVRDVPPYAIVGGNPARVIRTRFNEATIARLLALQWWRYSFYALAGLQCAAVGDTISAIQDAAEAGRLLPFEGERVRLLALAQCLQAR